MFPSIMMRANGAGDRRDAEAASINSSRRRPGGRDGTHGLPQSPLRASRACERLGGSAAPIAVLAERRRDVRLSCGGRVPPALKLRMVTSMFAQENSRWDQLGARYARDSPSGLLLCGFRAGFQHCVERAFALLWSTIKGGT